MRFIRRRGLDMFADFYTLSSFFEPKVEADVELKNFLFPHVRDELLEDALICIISESRYIINGPRSTISSCSHSTLQKVWYRFFSEEQRYNIITLSRRLVGQSKQSIIFGVYDYLYTHSLEVRFVKMMRILFNTTNVKWDHAYGGKSWENICKKWIAVYYAEDKKIDFAVLDQLIDACHNTGHCFDKLYKEATIWLRQKSLTQDPYWVVDQSIYRQYACRRLKEKFGWTKEKFRMVRQD